VESDRLEEMALYGELSFDITPKWQVTVGGRWYKYELETQTATDLPLLETTFIGSRGPNDIILEFEKGGQKDDGVLYKFNTRYEFTDDIMAYLTVSEGYRIGNSNGLALCDGTGGVQTVCASPREFQYFADSVTNYELGLHTQFFDRKLTINGSVYVLDWVDPQLSTSSQIGAAPIVINGEGAGTRGLELYFSALVMQNLTISGSYSYVRAELTENAPDLIRGITPPGFDVVFEDGVDGDRLPGSPEQQASLFATYSLPVGNSWGLNFNYGVNAISDFLTRTGARGGGEAIGGFTLHSASIVLDAEQWTVALYAKNLFDKYAVTGVRTTPQYIQTVSDENGDPVHVRSYSHDVTRPRELGLRVTYKFDL
jgi:outer membrane receptor protein involved in Fe transport